MKIQEIMIKMRDGIRLQNFINFPKGKGPFPSLLARCMYGADKLKSDAVFWTEKGYVVILQNIRGRHGSEGGPIGREDHPEDGFDTMEWIIAQPWSNKRIGTIGRSALARVQVATAFMAHPAHLAMSPVVLPYGMMSHLGGAMMFSQIPQWMYFAQSGNELNPFETVDWMPHLFKLPVVDVLDEIGGPVEEYRRIVCNIHDTYLKDPLDPDKFALLNTPNLMITGWYDHCGTGPIDFFMHTMRYGTEKQKQNTHLLIGPWDHSADGDESGEYDFGPDADLKYPLVEAEFFEHHLKGKHPAKSMARVKLFIMGKNQWRDEHEWPLSRAQETKFYLHSSGTVCGAWTRGELTTEPPNDEKSDRFTYDPADPVPTWGGANSAPARVLPMKRGARDQSITLYRKDVLTYYTQPLQEPLEVTGGLKLVLYAASSAADTDFTAKLMDVAPGGNARLLSDGVIRARFRNGLDKVQFIEPGKVYRYEIDLWFTSNEFQRGHCIALAISSSNFPRINRNLNTRGNNEQDSHYNTADQTIFHTAEYPSCLVLPVIHR